jgi:hypothetical protein
VDYLFDRLAPSHIVAVISVVCGCVVALAMIFAISKYQFQALADDTALRREKQNAEMAVRQKVAGSGADLNALLTPDGGPRDEETERLDAALAKRFGALGLDGAETEAALRRAMATDPARKATIVEVMDELSDPDNPIAPAAILAAVRPLCGGPAAAKAPAAC